MNVVVTRGKRSTWTALANTTSKELHDCTEETWDMPFDPKNALKASDQNYLKILDPGAILSKCNHQLVNVSCPCGVELKAKECTECNLYLCGNDCSSLKRASKWASCSERSSIGPLKARSEMDKVSGWIATTGGSYIRSRNLKEKERLKTFRQVVLTSFGAFEGIKLK